MLAVKQAENKPVKPERIMPAKGVLIKQRTPFLRVRFFRSEKLRVVNKQLRLYAVTDSSCLKNGISLAEAVEDAVKGGATIVQLREKNKSYEEILEMAKDLKLVCRKYGVPLIINDSIKIADQSGADGVHLGLEDGDLLYARRVLGEDAVIGATAHNLHEAQAAWAAGADYLGCGAVFQSPTKKNTTPISLEELKEICMKIPIPVVAIGGINYLNMIQLKDTGIAGVAVVSSLFAQDDIRTSAMTLKSVAMKTLENV